jgi:hypothetical protein
MPPPVPEGDAPMIMRTSSTNREKGRSPDMGIVLKPTVVNAVMDWKM